MQSFLFDASGPAVQAVHDLRGEGIDPRAIRLHLWDDGFCLRVRGPLTAPLASRIESLGGRAFDPVPSTPSDAGVATPSHTAVATESPRRRWWARR